MTKPTIPIDWGLFDEAYDIDENYHNPYSIDRYLDRTNGAIIFIYAEDSDAAMEGSDELENKEMRELINTNPDNYLEIVGRSHGESHEILQTFLVSSWTDDQNLKNRIAGLYNTSIGWWMKAIRNESELEMDCELIIEKYYRFKDDLIEKSKDSFLKQNGIKYRWV